MKFKHHNLVNNKYIGLGWSFDTFRTPEGYDRLIKNILRIIGIFGLIFLWNSTNLLLLPLIILAVMFAGTSEFVFVRNKFKTFKIEWWK